MTDTMNIIICATRNMYPQLHRMFVMLDRTQKTPYHVYAFVEDDMGLDDEPNITTIDVSGFEKVTKNEVNGRSHWTWMTLVRCYAPELLPDVDKVIYMDLDVEIVGDLRELWETDLEGCPVAGVIDTGIRKVKLPYIRDIMTYINVGVLVMDLHAFREMHVSEDMDELLHKWLLGYPDQDALNIVCDGKIKLLDNKWNSGPSTGISEEAVIYHTTDGAKPWNPSSKFFPSFARDYVESGAPFSFM